MQKLTQQNMKSTLLIMLLANSFLASTQTLNNDSGMIAIPDSTKKIIGIGFNISSFGPGPYAFYHLNKNIHIKAGLNYFFYNYSLNKLLSELDGEAKIRVGGIGAFAEWHFLRYLYFSGGVSTNFNKIDVNGKMAESIMIGDVEMAPENIGLVGIQIEPAWAFSPYVGFGIGRPVNLKNRFGYTLEIGSYFQGSPRVNLSATGMLEPTASSEQEMLIENNIKPLDFWPQIALSINYRINR